MSRKPVKIGRMLRMFVVLGGLLLILGLGVIFGKYPTTGIPRNTVAIEISPAFPADSTFVLTDAAGLRAATHMAGTVWNHFGYNSLDGPEGYGLTFITDDGKRTSISVTRTEWSEHGTTPDGFFDFLKRNQATAAQAGNAISRR